MGTRWKRNLRTILAGSLLCGGTLATSLLAGATPASAATSTVTDCGVSPTDTGSLPYAVTHASADSTITFGTGLSCPPSAPITITQTIDISQSLTIIGPGAGTMSVSGGGTYQVFDVTSGAVTISGLDIENGNAGSGTNGANRNVSVSASNGTAKPDGGGVGNNGGGIANSGTLTLEDDAVTGNSAGAGGVGGSGTITVTGSTEKVVIGDGGSGGSGGGIYNSGTLSLIDDTVSGNSTGVGGNAGTDTVTASGLADTLELSSGNGGDGGGIYNSGTLSLIDDTVSGNSTGNGGTAANGSLTTTGNDNILEIGAGDGGPGGGIYNSGVLTVTNSTVAGNTTGAGGTEGSDDVNATGTGDTFDVGVGGVSGVGGGIDAGAGTDTMGATIITGNTGSNCDRSGGTITSVGYNLTGDLSTANSCNLVVSTDKLGANPELGPLANNGGSTETLLPSLGSPALGAIPSSPVTTLNGFQVCPRTDQRGVANIGNCTIGATEPFAVSNASLPGATPGVAYGPVTLTTQGAASGATFSWKKVTLPKGLKFSSTGVLSGTPNAKLLAGQSSISVTVTERVAQAKATVEDTIPLTIT